MDSKIIDAYTKKNWDQVVKLSQDPRVKQPKIPKLATLKMILDAMGRQSKRKIENLADLQKNPPRAVDTSLYTNSTKKINGLEICTIPKGAKLYSAQTLYFNNKIISGDPKNNNLKDVLEKNKKVKFTIKQAYWFALDPNHARSYTVPKGEENPIVKVILEMTLKRDLDVMCLTGKSFDNVKTMRSWMPDEISRREFDEVLGFCHYEEDGTMKLKSDIEAYDEKTGVGFMGYVGRRSYQKLDYNVMANVCKTNGINGYIAPPMYKCTGLEIFSAEVFLCEPSPNIVQLDHVWLSSHFLNGEDIPYICTMPGSSYKYCYESYPKLEDFEYTKAKIVDIKNKIKAIHVKNWSKHHTITANDFRRQYKRKTKT